MWGSGFGMKVERSRLMIYESRVYGLRVWGLKILESLGFMRTPRRPPRP